VKAGSVDGPSPLARPVIVIADQEPVGLFFGQLPHQQAVT
jgi:hypothetical protein